MFLFEQYSYSQSYKDILWEILYSSKGKDSYTIERAEAKSSEKERVIKYKIKSITEKSFGYSFGEPEQNGSMKTIAKYDVNGNKIYVWENTCETYYTFDSKNRIIEMKLIISPMTAPNKITKQELYKYDNKNNLLEQIELVDGKEKSKNIYQYDGKNKKIEYIMYWLGVMSDKRVYKYNDKGLCTEEIKYEKDGTNTSFYFDDKGNKLSDGVNNYKYEYDSQANIVETRVTYPSNLSRSIMYNERQNILVDSFYNATTGDITCQKYKYNTANQLIELTSLNKGLNSSNNGRYTITYNSNGEIIEILNNNNDGVFKTGFKYDKEGNILEKINYDIKGNPNYLIKYSYEFFKRK